MPPEAIFPDVHLLDRSCQRATANTAAAYARALCAVCVHVEECRDWAIRNSAHLTCGVWGGLTVPELRAARVQARRETGVSP